MSHPINLRCQTKAGQHYLTGLYLSSSIRQLKEHITEATKIPIDCIKVRQGYPPKVIDLGSDSNKLSSLPFRSGDTLIVEEDKSLRKKRQEHIDNELHDQINRSNGILMRKVVPADNSCLFTSVDCVMNNGIVDLTSAPQMRELIAGIVMSDPTIFNEVYLGKPNLQYCSWIMNPDSWGGAIEIAILSQYYNIEIDVVDTQTGRMDMFGEDKNYARRVLLIYDGVHYDPLIMEPLIPGDAIQTIFSTDDHRVSAQAMEIANEAKAARQYTDVSKFTLHCRICEKAFVGQKEAQAHAQATRHVDFSEF